MKAPTLRDLIGRATPGPWHYDPAFALCVEAETGNVALTNLARNNPHDAKLIARCNPHTMHMVITALENAKDRIEQAEGSLTKDDPLEIAISALNSTSP